MLSPLEQSILAALVYFDIFDYPLTLMEVHRYLLRVNKEFEPRPYALREVNEALQGSEELGRVVRGKNGYFYLRGREHILRARAESFIVAADKYRRARRTARWLSGVPFVRLVAVCNSLAYSHARAESDIDLFIIAKQSGLWWARGWALLILKLLRARPGQGGVRDKICLSFFAGDKRLNLQSLQAGADDIYFPMWLGAVYPLYDAGQYYQRWWQANNWTREYLTNIRALIPHPWRRLGGRSLFRYLAELILAPFNRLAGALQLRIFPANIKALVNLDTRVRVELGLLKFHTNDRRSAYAREFSKRLRVISAGLV